MKFFGILVVVLTVGVLTALTSPSPSAAQMEGGSSGALEVRVTSVTSSSAVVSWKTEDSEPGLMLIGTGKSSLDTRLFNPAPSQYHAEKLIGLRPNTTYFFSFQELLEEQPKGNALAGQLYSFATLPELETQRSFIGVVTSLSTDGMTVAHQNTGEIIDVALAGDIPAISAGGNSTGSLSIGSRVVVLADLTDGKWVAERVVVKPEKANLPISGIVVGTEESEFVVSDGEGSTQTIAAPQVTSSVQVGEFITVLKAPTGQVKSVYKAVDLQRRLSGFLEKLVSEVESEVESQQASGRAEQLLNLLDGQLAHQQQVFESVLSHTPSQARDSLFAARARLQDIGEDRKEIQERVREKFGLGVNSSSPGQGASKGQDSPNKQEGEPTDSGKDSSVADTGNQNEAPGNSEDKKNSGGQGAQQDEKGAGSNSNPDDSQKSSESGGAADSPAEGKDSGPGASQEKSEKETGKDSDPSQGKNEGNGPNGDGGGGGGGGMGSSPSEDHAAPESDKGNGPGASGANQREGPGRGKPDGEPPGQSGGAPAAGEKSQGKGKK